MSDEVRMLLLGCPCQVVIIGGLSYGLWRLVRMGDRAIGRRKGRR